jgi:hypothetical protein
MNKDMWDEVTIQKAITKDRQENKTIAKGQ